MTEPTPEQRRTEIAQAMGEHAYELAAKALRRSRDATILAVLATGIAAGAWIKMFA
ncbi:hypothetical protein IC762_17570 [Bradyrhizobium genosp. L]|uniref:hypothetical protein n=1 Tax=Bradyrhizobium genosp. L TaxID=83637 RepID=UPI0018A32E9B|nr:hypothetical protein [Bradyrhizobium genosp. L]QPF81636.1 hypothetical protein IC762_17570 [Bradyrhizobium genosp. L]